LIQVYTGSGKGKTTAAFGLALRAAGAGKKIYICQFLKGRCYSEESALEKLRNIRVERFGTTCLIRKKPSAKDILLAKKALTQAKKALKKFDLIILDEINVALKLKLLGVDDVLNLLKRAPRKTELVLTGRYAPKEILKAADLVSEVKEVKHYYQKGVRARRGIEF